MHLRSNLTLTCGDVHIIPKEQRCQFVKSHCDTAEYRLGVFNYIQMYYCTDIKVFPVTFILSSLVLSFVSLGLTASDYLCANLYSISKFLDLSDNLAGLTLLAIGNGSPDTLGTYKALKIGSNGLAISELTGAAFFILTVVTGSICIVSPFKVPKYNLMRDVFFYVLVFSLLWVSLMIGRLNFFISAVLASVYVLYVVVAVFSHRWLRRNTRKRVAAARILSRFDGDDALVSMADDMDQSYFDRLSALPPIDVLSTSSDDTDAVNEFGNYLRTHPHDISEERAPVETGTYGLHVLLRELSKHSIHVHSAPLLAHVQWLTDARPMTAPPATLVTTDHDTTLHFLAYQDNVENGTDEANENSGGNENTENSRNKGTILLRFSRPSLTSIALQFLPDYGTGTFWARTFYFMCAPTNIVLKLTTPIRENAIEYGELAVTSSNAFTFQTTDQNVDDDFDDFDFRSDVQVFRIQMVIGPMFLMLMLLRPVSLYWVYYVVVVVLALCASILIPAREPRFDKHLLQFRAWNYLGAFVGFALSLLWISIFATEIIAVIKTISMVMRLSDDILGSTVFALGNSIGDLVSDLTVARMGMPVMAFGACFGGPLFSLCALGLSAMLVMSKNHQADILLTFSPTLKLNLFALLVSQVFILVFVPRNGWMFGRRLGAILIGFWVVITVLSILLEVKSTI